MSPELLRTLTARVMEWRIGRLRVNANAPHPVLVALSTQLVVLCAVDCGSSEIC
jgi:hypothetical protein